MVVNSTTPTPISTRTNFKNKKKKNNNTIRNNTKWSVFNLAKCGDLYQSAIARILNKDKSGIRNHLDHLINSGLIEKFGMYYHATYKGESITYMDFCRIFNHRGVVEDTLKFKDEFRNHNIWFTGELIKKPHKKDLSTFEEKEWSKNNFMYIKKYDVGCVYVYTNKIKIQISDFTTSTQGEAVIEESKRLVRLINYLEKDGFKECIGKTFIPIKSHIALMKTAFVSFFATEGSITLVPSEDNKEPRLFIDWSHGKGELEAGNPQLARDDIQKTADFLSGLINREKGDFWKKFDKIEKIINLVENNNI